MNAGNRAVAAVMVLLVLLSTIGATRAQTNETFKARLSTSPLPQPLKAMGSGSISAQLHGNTLVINGSFEGLRAPASAARLHRGPKLGVRGPAIFDLTVTNATSGMVTGSVELTAAQIDDLKSGRLYIQIEPEGGVWGWLLR